MPKYDVIVIGASAGGVEALKELVAGLSPDLNAAVLIVLHLPVTAPSVLPEILTREHSLPAVRARDGMDIRPGCIYTAPPGLHMTVGEDHKIHLIAGPRENSVRPSIDVLFRTVAQAYGPHVVGVILSGTLGDGTIGLKIVKQHGGLTVVQDPEDAAFPGMPKSAIANVNVDYILPVRKIGPFLNELMDTDHSETGVSHMSEAAPIDDSIDSQIKKDVKKFEQSKPDTGQTVLTCPDCGGVLWELKDGNLVRWECHVGHRFLTDGLIEGQENSLETALWSAIRLLEERAFLSARMANLGTASLGLRYRNQAATALKSAEIIRQLIHNNQMSKNQAD